MSSNVTPERAREIIAAYGAAPRRWPAAEREAMLACVAEDAALAQLLDEARGLDDLLATAPSPPAIAVNPVAIAAGARSAGARARPRAAPRLRWRIAGMAAAAVLGFVVGVSGLAPRDAPDREDAAAAFAAMVEEDAL